MNKRKIMALCLVVCLLAIAVVGGTLAYFTDTAAAKNVMVIGNVTIEQNELQRDENGQLTDFVQNKKLYPAVYENVYDDGTITDEKYGTFPIWDKSINNEVDKFISVTNTGSEPAYVRTVLAFETELVESDSGTENLFDVYIQTYSNAEYLLNQYITLNGEPYQLMVCVYEDPLAAGQTTAPSLKQFFLMHNAGNEVTDLFGDEYTILAVSQAVQTTGFEPELDANGNVAKTAAEVALDTAFGEVNAANAAAWFEAIS